MKKFKQLFEESPAADYKPKVDDEEEVKGYKPRSPDEEKFLKLHKIDKKGHPIAPDAQHTGDRSKGKTGKTGEDHDGAEEKGEPILKTYNQFMKMGGHGGDSYKGVGKSGGEKAPVMQGSSKIKEEVELDEAKMYAIGYHFLHGLKNQNMKKSKDFKTKKEAEKAANDIVRAKGGRAEVYANMFDPGGRPGHQDYPKLLKTIKEEADLVDEAFKAGNLRLKDGKTVKIDKVTAESLNNAMSQLNSTNRKRMEVEAMKDKKSFDAMVQFAKAAV